MAAGSSWSPAFSRGELLTSYSQNAEDVRLWRVFSGIECGFYVDVGAADPYVDSVTHLFYERGWSGVNVEPSPCFEALAEARPRDVNLRVAVGESEGSVPFFLTRPYLGLSTLDPAAHEGAAAAIDSIEEVRVPRRRLESILEDHAAGRTIHFLKVDVEGAEHEVLASSDWSSYRPVVVLAEAIASCSTTPTHEDWEYILLDAGYRFAAFDGINRFYVEERHADLVPDLAYPVSALDQFVKASASERQLERVREELDSVFRSRTWRAARVLAGAAAPVRAAGRRLRGRRR
jgi:FkbM family methyltransferase